MLRKLRPRSAYDVMAAIGFFIAVAGGSAYAAATIGSADIKKDAVLGGHIKNGAVKNGDLGANAVATGKVLDRSLLKQDFKAGQLAKGAISYDGQVAVDGLFHEVGRVNGVLVQVRCGSPTGALIQISRVNHDANHGFYGFGTKT